MSQLKRRWTLILIIIFIIGVGYKTIRIAIPAVGLLGDVSDLRTLAAEPDPTTINPAELTTTTASLRQNTTNLRNELELFFPIMNNMGWFPGFGQEISNAPELLDVADLLAEAGDILSQDLAHPVLTSWQQDSEQDLTRLLATAVLDANAPLITAQANLITAERQLGRLDLDGMLGQDQLEALRNRLPDANLTLSTLIYAPHAFGLTSQEQNYLVVLQNEDELRPTGGFISAVGVIRFVDGGMDTITFEDSYVVDNPNAPVIPAPPTLANIMLVDRWVFRDGNWSPDGPTAAQDLIEIYQNNTGTRIDGVVMLNQAAVVQLMRILEPLDLPESPEPITSANLQDYMRNAYSGDAATEVGVWWQNRKQFIQTLFEAITERLQNDYAELDPMLLVDVLRQTLDEKHIVMNFNHPGLSSVVADEGWTGDISIPSDSDFLMVVNSNLGFNKVNAVVEHQMTYRVSLAEQPFAQLSLAYQHPGSALETCIHEAQYGDTYAYQELIERCYWNYIRVYPRPETRVLESSTHPIVGETLLATNGWDGNVRRGQEQAIDNELLQPIEQMIVVPSGGQATVTMTYTLPDSIVQQDGNTYTYQLLLQKQSGVAAVATEILVDLPLDATFQASSLPPDRVTENNVVAWTVDLRQDVVLSLTYTRD